MSWFYLVVAALLLHAGVAFGADDDCVVPQFEKTRHVYISPALEQDADLRAKLAGLQEELVATGASGGIVPYFVACQMNYREGLPGPALVDSVFETWKSFSDFRWQGRVVVIAWVRNGMDTNQSSVGAHAGEELSYDWGFTASSFAAKDGPVLVGIRNYMPQNPKGEFVNIVRRMDEMLDRDAKRDAFFKLLAAVTGFGLLVLLMIDSPYRDLGRI